jgi:hypothetical protein
MISIKAGKKSDTGIFRLGLHEIPGFLVESSYVGSLFQGDAGIGVIIVPVRVFTNQLIQEMGTE